MQIGSFKLPKRFVTNIKVAYHDCYLKSREFSTSPKQQDIALEMLLNELIDNVLKKSSIEENYSEEKSKEFMDEIIKFIAQWKEEFDDAYYNIGIKNIKKRNAWWQFWKS